MKGHIFNLLEDFITEIAGFDAYEEILNKCQLISGEGFISPATYPDEDLVEIVAKTVEHLGITVEIAHFEFGKWIFAHLIELIPEEFTQVDHPITLLETLDHIHQVELKKLYPDADPPRFRCEKKDAQTALFYYDSLRELKHLVDGVLLGMGTFFKYDITYTREAIPGERGNTVFQYELTFSPLSDVAVSEEQVAVGSVD
ncbi:MAG: heme NO-binding domain-containing protein [Rhodothermales bacterium]